MIRSLALCSVLLSQAANAQYEGGYYLWRNQLHPEIQKCASTAPNEHWTKVSGPYFDGECSKLLPQPDQKNEQKTPQPR